MREIEFRGKRKDNGEWVYGAYFNMHHNDGRKHIHHFIIPDNTDISLGTPIEKIQVEINPDTVGQFTGLKDCNGRDIYEGDIMTYGGSIKHIVEFKHGMFGYTLLDGWFVGYGGNSNFTFNPLDKSKEHEVIGNIHEQRKEE